ncbi:MAG: methionine adenosyltransferase [Peptoniphilaceae bacterium]|nr:methionine adenosyltransferase [Peptoniphilaceae bacterium]
MSELKRVKGRLRTAESVTEGHPDKVCDQIADAILDEILRQDPTAHSAIEVMASTGIVFVMGELSTSADVDINAIVRRTIQQIGYTDAPSGIDYENCAIIQTIREQSPDIAQGVGHSEEARAGEADTLSAEGAGDQGIVFGYASDETPELMPMPIMLAHQLAKRLAKVRKEGIIANLRPDGKTQVSIEYDEDDRPKRVDAILISTQHGPGMDQKQLKEDLWDHVVKETVDPRMIDSETRFYVNPTGKFEIGGPNGDTGLTGRKLIVDTYGGMAHHGGGSFSGKDASKVDRSGAYYARYVAKNIVAAGLARRCEVAVAYAIGRAQPFSLGVNTFGTGAMDDAALLDLVKEVFDFRPGSIIQNLGLTKPIYQHTASYGHFGRTDHKYPWEETDKVEQLKALAAER